MYSDVVWQIGQLVSKVCICMHGKPAGRGSKSGTLVVDCRRRASTIKVSTFVDSEATYGNKSRAAMQSMRNTR